MRFTISLFRFLFLAVTVPLLAGTGLLISNVILLEIALLTADLERATAKKQLEIAKSLWTARNLNHYRLVVVKSEHPRSSDQCQQDIEIQDEKVITVFQDTCKDSLFVKRVISEQPSLTITDLFHQIEHYTSKRQCGPNGCQCDGVIRANVVYDTQFGYPHTMSIELKPFPYQNWIWTCTLVGFSSKKFSVLSLSPYLKPPAVTSN